MKRSLQKCSNFSAKTLKEQNIAVLDAANFAKRFIQSFLRRLSYLLLVFSFSLFLISLIGFIWGHGPVQMQSFYTSANITDENIAGFDLNSSTLSFGKIGRGSSSVRNIEIQNGFNFPVAAVIRAEGDIGRLLNFEKVVEIGAGESRKIGFSASALPDIKEGFYAGNVSFELYRL